MLQHFEESMNLFQGQIEEIEGLLASNQNTDAVYGDLYLFTYSIYKIFFGPLNN